MTITEYINERIKYVEKRIEFWKDNSDIQQVWKGIKVELEATLKYDN